MADPMVLLGNDIGCKVGFIVDQQGPQVYLKKELKVAGLATRNLPFLGQVVGEPVQPVPQIQAVRQQVLALAERLK